MAAEVLLKICSSITTDLLETYMLEKVNIIYLDPQLLELIYDADSTVKCAAVKMFFTIGDNLSFLEKKNRLCKLFFEFLCSPNEEINKIMSKVSGKIFHILHFFMTQNL
jgi:serine/threonine-protein phosphatase 4 regulatory subunit 4